MTSLAICKEKFDEWNFEREESILSKMAVCEYHKEYTDYLNQRISSELVPDRFPANRTLSQVWSVVQNTATCHLIGNISPAEARLIYNTLFCLYPQFEKSLEEKLEEAHLG